MTKGKPLSDAEKDYISTHKDEMFYSQIAANLSELYPEDNNGSRCQATIRRFIQTEGEEVI